MATLYFFCDESGKYRKNPSITVSGVGAESHRLNAFNIAWGALLRSNGLTELHMSHVCDIRQSCGPRMPAGQSIPERINALLPFADCINEHLEIGLMQGWDVKGYNNLPLEVKRNLGGSPDPLPLAFVRGMLEIGDYIRPDESFSVVCDDDELTAWDVYLHYRAVSKSYPELGKKLAGITFAKSHFFTPLQAADMVAFLARKETSNKFWNTPNEFAILLEYLRAGPKPGTTGGIMQWRTAHVDEQGFVNLAAKLLGEKDGKKSGVPEVPQHDAKAGSSTSQRDQGQAGSGESSKS